MEGIRKKKNYLIISKITKKKKIVFFLVFFIIILFFNIHVLLEIGPSNYIYSFKNPSAYYSCYIKIDYPDGTYKYQKCIIQKTSNSGLTLIEDDEICVSDLKENKGVFSIISVRDLFQNKSINGYKDIELQLLKNQEKIIGKIITYQNNNPMEIISFSYWGLCKDILNINNIFNQTQIYQE